jgi:hypothetical protein
VELEYDELTITVTGNQRDVDDWDEAEFTDSYTYRVEREDVINVLLERFLMEEDVEDLPGGLEALEDEETCAEFFDLHFDMLFEKYYKNLLDYFEDDAIEEFSNNTSWSDYEETSREHSWDYDEDSRVDESFEEMSNYKDKLRLCPECGETAFNIETGFCINCGFNMY